MGRHASRWIPSVIAALTVGVLGGGTVFADTSRPGPEFGVRSGVYTEDDSGFLGAEALTPMGHSWYFNPNFEYAFADRGDLWDVNADFHYDVIHDRPYYVWLGAGPAVLVRETEPGVHRSEPGVNLIAGIGFKQPRVTPYLQSKVTLADDSQVVLAFGFRF